MEKRFVVRRLLRLLCAAGVMALANNASAAAFQLYEQDGASVGDYHAGRAAQANDASTSFYNPAGLTRIHNQQFVIGDVAVLSDLKYRGTVSVNTIGAGAPVPVTAQGGAFSTIPDISYAAPITDWMSFGFSVVAPFGLKTDWGRNTNLQYNATATELAVVDVSPALAFKITPKISVGAGFDWQRMAAEFNQDATLGGGLTAVAYNKAWSTAYGGHLGVLFSPLENTRVGLAYNSQIVHHVRGTSKLVGPAADFVTSLPFNGGVAHPVVSTESNAHVTLPAYTTLSGFQKINDRWAVMGTAIYTQWSVFKTLTLNDIAVINTTLLTLAPGVAIPVPAPFTNASVSMDESYRNAWNLSVGSEFYATDKITFRGGLGYDQSPVRNHLRDVRIPDSSRYAVALGGHYQGTKALGFDIGWTHLFVPGTSTINPPASAVGGQVTALNGTMQASADIIGAQVTWDIV
jgi:long-chain fatty acid transport protein